MSGRDLTADESELAHGLLMSSDDTGLYWLAFSSLLHAKGETTDELEGICRAVGVYLDTRRDVIADLDTSGSGRRPYSTLNVGTAVAFVSAAAGLRVAKQASGAVTGTLGSSDLMQAVGVNLSWPRDELMIRRALDECRVAVVQNFLLSGRQSTRATYLKMIREAGMRIASSFHLVGNVEQVVRTRHRVLGCFDEGAHAKLVPLLLRRHERFAVVSGFDGLDEVSLCGASRVTFNVGDGVSDIVIDPSNVGCGVSDVDAVISEGRAEKLRDFVRVLGGAEGGPKRELVVVNAAVALWVGDVEPSLSAAAENARRRLDERSAWEGFVKFVEMCGRREQLRDICEHSGVSSG